MAKNIKYTKLNTTYYVYIYIFIYLLFIKILTKKIIKFCNKLILAQCFRVNILNNYYQVHSKSCFNHKQFRSRQSEKSRDVQTGIHPGWRHHVEGEAGDVTVRSRQIFLDVTWRRETFQPQRQKLHASGFL